MAFPIPDEITAFQFATMLRAGFPAIEALSYFIETSDPQELGVALKTWTRSRLVKKAMLSLMGGVAWQDMTTDQMMSNALDLHYRQLATLLHNLNYIEAGQTEKSKMDAARVAIESKMAGQAGRGDALSRFFEDLQAGRIKLNSSVS